MSEWVMATVRVENSCEQMIALKKIPNLFFDKQ